MIITFGANKFSKDWLGKELTWCEFKTQYLLKPKIIKCITVDKYHKLEKNQKDKIKDGPAFVAGKLDDKRRCKSSLVSRELLTLDLDNLDKNQNIVSILEDKIKKSWFLYPTFSHTYEKPKYRLIIPLSESIGYNQFEKVSDYVMELVGLSFFDTTCRQPDRLMYLPKITKDAKYECHESKHKEFLDPGPIYGDMPSERFKAPLMGSQTQDGKLVDPSTKGGRIGAFCSIFSISSAIEEFLPHIYEPTIDEPTKYNYLAGSVGKGLHIHENDTYCYAFNNSDRANTGHNLNAYDLVMLHLFDGDESKMADLVLGNAECKELIDAENAQNDFSELAFDDEVDAPTKKKTSKKFNLSVFQRYYLKKYCDKILFSNGYLYHYEEGIHRIKKKEWLLDLISDKLNISRNDTPSYRNAVYDFLSIKCALEEDTKLNSHSDLIVFRNITLKNFKVKEHNPKYYHTFKINFEYDDQAESSLWKKYLDTCLGEEYQKLLQEMMGYIMLTTIKAKAFFIISGETDSGKSVLAEIIETLIGGQNISQISLQDLCSTNRFAASSLYGKKLNISKETDFSYLKNTAILKQLTGDVNMNYEGKYKDPFTGACTATNVFLANQIPELANLDQAYFNRLHIIAFKGTIAKSKQDKDLSLKLTTEESMEGIIRWSLDGLKRLIDNNYDFTPADELDKERHKIDSINSLAFFEDVCEIEEGAFTPSQDLYNAYCQWCKNQGHTNPFKQKKFIEHIGKQHKNRGVKSDVKRFGGDIKRGLKNVKMSNDEYNIF